MLHLWPGALNASETLFVLGPQCNFYIPTKPLTRGVDQEKELLLTQELLLDLGSEPWRIPNILPEVHACVRHSRKQIDNGLEMITSTTTLFQSLQGALVSNLMWCLPSIRRLGLSLPLPIMRMLVANPDTMVACTFSNQSKIHL